MHLKQNEREYWNQYLDTCEEKPVDATVHASVVGNETITDQLIELYLSGKKTAGSEFVKDYELSGDDLPKVGNFWVVLDSQLKPRCILRTIRVEYHQFSEVPLEVAIAEGEGDLSLENWRQIHKEFFSQFIDVWGITDLETEKLVVEFFEVVYQ